MSAATTTDRLEDTSLRDNSPPQTSTMRVWPAVVMLAVFWAFLYANHTLDMSMFARFISRMAAFGVMLLCFLGWWLSRSAISWRDRLLAIVVALVIGVGTRFFLDKSIDGFGLFFGAFPWVMTAWIVWLVVARSLTPAMQRAGFVVAMLLACGYFTLVRFDGLDAVQRGEFSWRWMPTKEQLFLASRREAQKLARAESARPWTPQAGDSLGYRGPHRDGAVPGVQLTADWKTQPPKMLWRAKVGPGWSSMIVVDGHVVTQEQRGEEEVVACYDATTGQEIWSVEDAVRFTESLSGAGPRGTPTFADGHVYSLGALGMLNSIAADTGSIAWSTNVVDDAGVAKDEIPQWGYSVSPLVVDGLVVVFAGGSKDRSILAYQATDGKLAWSCPGGKQSYSSPQLVTLGGQKQIVMHDNGAVRGINIADGKQLWEHPNGTEMSLPMLQPHVTEAGELVVALEPGIVLLEVKQDGDKWTVTQKWASNVFRPGFNDFVIHKDCVYGLTDGVLCAIDLANGKRLWKKGRLGFGQVLLLPEQNALVVSSDKGEIILVSVDRAGYKELGRFQAIEGKTWNGPVLVGGRLFLRNGEEMAAYELEAKGPPTDEGMAVRRTLP
jgi:outer membrane protein assembly factor BamB